MRKVIQECGNAHKSKAFIPFNRYVVFFVLSTALALGQSSGDKPRQAPGQPTGQGDIGIQVQPASPPAEKKITPEEAQQLFASIDDTLTWLSKDTGFTVKKKVKGELASRDQVAKYVDDRLTEDEDAKRLERSEIVLKKFASHSENHPDRQRVQSQEHQMISSGIESGHSTYEPV